MLGIVKYKHAFFHNLGSVHICIEGSIKDVKTRRYVFQ